MRLQHKAEVDKTAEKYMCTYIIGFETNAATCGMRAGLLMQPRA